MQTNQQNGMIKKKSLCRIECNAKQTEQNSKECHSICGTERKEFKECNIF